MKRRIPLSSDPKMREIIKEKAKRYTELDPEVAEAKAWIEYARELKQDDPYFFDTPRGGTCPVCGTPSPLGYIDESGALRMMCPKCFSTWRVQRGICPYCGAEEIHYQRDVKANWVKVYTCEKCGSKWVVIDERSEDYIRMPREAYWLIVEKYLW